MASLVGPLTMTCVRDYIHTYDSHAQKEIKRRNNPDHLRLICRCCLRPLLQLKHPGPPTPMK